MTVNDTLDILKQNDVMVYQPDTFKLKEFIDQFSRQNDTEIQTFTPVGDTDTRIEFFADYRPNDTEFCTVIADDIKGQHILLSEDERGHLVGHLNEVELYLKENCPYGFYNVDEAIEKIEDYQDKFDPVDEDYMEHLQKMAEGLSDEEMYYDVDDEDSQMMEEINSPLEHDVFFEEQGPKVDLSDASVEEQLEFLDRELEPGGKIDMLLKDIEQTEERPEADAKFEEYGIDRSVSEKVREYFTPTEEKAPYFEIMQRGFIPYELREGFSDSRIDINPDLKLTQDIVKEVRGKIDPEFGKVAGIDTTKFYTRNEDGIPRNISIIPMAYDDIRPYLYGDEQFSKEDVVSVRAIKEFGSSMEVQGTKFGVNNLVTVEVKMQDHEVYRSSLIVDDSGTARARLDFLAGDYEHTFRFETGNDLVGGDKVNLIHFDKLDRTVTGNRGHFSIMDKKEEAFREKFLNEVEERLPGFFSDLVDKFDEDLDPQEELGIGRRDYMELNIDELKVKYNSLHSVTNLVELYKDNLEAKAYRANQACAKLDDKINFADMDRKQYTADSKEYQEISANMETYKAEYAKAYSEYLDNRDKFLSASTEAEDLRSQYFELGNRLEATQEEFDKLFEGKSANGSDDDTVDDKLSPEDRFAKFCDISLLRSDMVPTDVSYDFGEVLSEKEDVIKEAFQSITDIVDKYNASVEHDFEKVLLSDTSDIDSPGMLPDGRIHTASGFEVEAPGIARGRDISVQYSPDANYEPYKNADDMMVRKPQPDIKGEIYTGHAGIYALGKPEGLERSRLEIRDDFLKQEIYLGADKQDISITDHSLSEKMLDTELLHEMDAIRSLVNDHRGETFDDLSKYREEIDEYKREIDERTEKTEISSEDNAIDADTGDSGHIDKDSETDKKDSNIDKHIRSGFFGPKGQINEKKDVEISEGKKVELKQEAEKEAEKSNKSADEIYQEKVKSLTEKLDVMKSDILHYREKMETFGDIPTKYLSRHTGFQVAKVEFDSAIHMYGEMGGKVENSFVTKGLDAKDLFISKLELLNSNIFETKIIDAFVDRKTNDAIRDVYQKADGVEAFRYSGKMGAVLNKSLNALNVIGWPLIKLAEMRIKWLDLDLNTLDRFEKHMEKDEKQDTDMRNEERSDIESSKEPEAEVSRDALGQESSAFADTDGIEEKKDFVENNSKQNDQDKSEQMEQSENESKDLDSKEEDMDKDEDLSNIEKPDEKAEQIEQSESERKDLDTKEESADKDGELSKEEKTEKLPESDEKDKQIDQSENEPKDLEAKEESNDKKDDLSNVEKPEKFSETDKRDKQIDQSEDGQKEKADIAKEQSRLETDVPDKKLKNEQTSDIIKDGEPQEDIKKDAAFVEEPKVLIDKDSEVENASKEEIDKDTLESDKDIEKSEDTDKDLQAEDNANNETAIEPDEEKLSKDGKDDAMAAAGDDIEEGDSHIIYYESDSESTQDESDEPDKSEDDTQMENKADDENKNDNKMADLKEEIKEAVGEREELDEVMSHAIDSILQGAEPADVLETMIDGLRDCLSESPLLSENVGDVVYEIMNLFEAPPVDTLDAIIDHLGNSGIPESVTDAIQEYVAEIFDHVEQPYQDTEIGEYGDFEFSPEEVFDAATGNEDIDYSMSADFNDFDTDIFDMTDIDGLSNDMDALQMASDMQEDMEIEGVHPDVASDVCTDVYDHIYEDAMDGVDVFAENYQQDIYGQAFEQAQDVMENKNNLLTSEDKTSMDVDRGMDFPETQGIDMTAGILEMESVDALEGMEAAESIDASLFLV